MQLPSRTELTMEIPGDSRGLTYTATVAGPCPWGMRLTVPVCRGRMVSLPAGTPLQCSAFTGGTWLIFDTRVIGYERTEPPYMVVAPPANVREHDRRMALRLRKELEAFYVLLDDPLARKVPSYTIDISSTGAQISVARKLAPGTKLKLALEIPGHQLEFTGAVAWCRGVPLRAGIRFYGTRGGVQALWDRFLFQVERELMQTSP